MSAYVFVYGTIKDPQTLQTYSKAAGHTITAHGGAIRARGAPLFLAGARNRDQNANSIAAVIEFPDLASARGWYESADYQA